MTKKYYGVWNEMIQNWSRLIPPKLWEADMVIGGIALWSDKNILQQHLDSFFGKAIKTTFDESFKIKDFTPKDALLVKCGKI